MEEEIDIDDVRKELRTMAMEEIAKALDRVAITGGKGVTVSGRFPRYTISRDSTTETQSTTQAKTRLVIVCHMGQAAVREIHASDASPL